MLNKAIAVSILALSISAPFASAFSVVSTDYIKGTVAEVNAEKNTIVIEKNTGKTETLTLSSEAKFVMDGEQSSLQSLEEGSTVSIKHKTYTPVTESIEGEIVSLNHKTNTARIRLDSKDVIEVRFGNNVTVTGAVAANSIDQLRKGYQVVLRYAQN
ncbi:hypothetical protein [Teredinibacter haidensis]|mgnify:CR=1 FL=1|uniref:hypothetical protein n=1 Tax=Teredinibacter haidensis TaxID=2731755 RepID=UPI000948D68B|nr:hypothetical protein [Teredinibacter haidensis]